MERSPPAPTFQSARLVPPLSSKNPHALSRRLSRRVVPRWWHSTTSLPFRVECRSPSMARSSANTQYKYTKDGELSVYRHPSGYSGADIAEYGQPGSNGLTLDPQGRLTINQHGNHRVVRDERDGSQTVLADNYEGKRLNSPNDLVYRSDGTLFFTDPPFGFPKFFNDPRKQLPFSGVYSIYQGKLQLVSKDFTGPNGIAFSPNEKYLYLGNWPRSLTGQELRKEDETVGDIGDKHKAIMRYEVQPDGTLKNGKLFFDFTNAPGEDGLDGIKVDRN